MKKLFISTPMAGKTPEEIRLRIDELHIMTEEYLGEKLKVIKSYHEGYVNLNPIKAIGRSIAYMADADVIIFDHGYGNSRGCRVEKEVAINYKIPIRLSMRKIGKNEFIVCVKDKASDDSIQELF